MSRLQLGMVSLTWRESSSRARAALLAADSGPDAPGAALLASGAARGLVRLETCSRVEWLFSAEDPSWAASLLRAGLLARVGASADGSALVFPRAVRARTGAAALDHLLRVAVGLDAVVEGERAVGNQVGRAFEVAHAAGATDPALRRVWRGLGQLLARRTSLPGVAAGGVHGLAAATLREAGLGPSSRVEILGTGNIARQVRGAWPTARAWPRAQLQAFLDAAEVAEAVVLCTAGPAPWVDLPERAGALCVDVGAPPQARGFSGWNLVDLDTLLTSRRLLEEPALLALEALVAEGREGLAADLLAPPPGELLAAVDATHRAFLTEELPELTATLPPAAAAEVRARVGRLRDRLIRRVRAVATQTPPPEEPSP
jgi:glutamyl-tRNA reductase